MELRGLEPQADSGLTCENDELPERICDELEFAKGQRREADEPGAPAGPHTQREQTLGPTVRDAVVELHTKGRKSGLPRSCYLTTLFTTPSGWWWSSHRRTGMTATLTGTAISRRRRDATLVKNGQRHAVHARTASAAEKAELWPKIVASASRLMRAANSKPRSVSLGKTRQTDPLCRFTRYK